MVCGVTAHLRASSAAEMPGCSSSTNRAAYCDPAGYLLTVRYDTGQLFRITPAGRISEVAVGKRLVGGDGLALTRDRKLVAITNKLGAPGVEAATVLTSRDDFRSAQVRSTEAWPVAGPTTAAMTPRGIYMLSGRIDVLIGGGQSDEFTIRRLSQAG